MYALTLNTLQKSDQLNQLINETQILLNEPRFDPWLARILITELIWGKQRLTGNAKPIETVLNYEGRLRNALKNINASDIPLPLKTGKKVWTFYYYKCMFFAELGHISTLTSVR